MKTLTLVPWPWQQVELGLLQPRMPKPPAHTHAKQQGRAAYRRAVLQQSCMCRWCTGPRRTAKKQERWSSMTSLSLSQAANASTPNGLPRAFAATPRCYDQPRACAARLLAHLPTCVHMRLACCPHTACLAMRASFTVSTARGGPRLRVQRVVRSIFTAEGSLAVATTVLPGEKVCYSLRCLLPAQLPPTFHGTAARFVYDVSARCRIRALAGTPSAPSSPATSPSAQVRHCRAAAPLQLADRHCS